MVHYSRHKGYQIVEILRVVYQSANMQIGSEAEVIIQMKGRRRTIEHKIISKESSERKLSEEWMYKKVEEQNNVVAAGAIDSGAQPVERWRVGGNRRNEEKRRCDK